MNEYNKLLTLTTDDRVELADSFKSLLHTSLVLGQTRYMCRYGTLSDGHEKITPSQRYYQSIKEMWYIGQSIRDQRTIAMESQADLMDAEESLDKATKASDKLRAEAKIQRAKNRIISALVMVEDQMRMLDEYNAIRQELKPQVEAQYPKGIEQAEQDNWVALAKYRHIKGQTPGIARPTMSDVPLDPVTKAQLGVLFNRPDMFAGLMVDKEDDIRKLGDSGLNEYVGIPAQLEEKQ